jgi:hypothetical protein
VINDETKQSIQQSQIDLQSEDRRVIQSNERERERERRIENGYLLHQTIELRLDHDDTLALYRVVAQGSTNRCRSKRITIILPAVSQMSCRLLMPWHHLYTNCRNNRNESRRRRRRRRKENYTQTTRRSTTQRTNGGGSVSAGLTQFGNRCRLSASYLYRARHRHQQE